MQNYDEKYFNAKANRRAGTTWLALMVIVTVYYGVKVSSGEISKDWFIVFSIIGWIQYFVAGIALKIRGMDYAGYKWIMGIGYLLYFAVIAWTALDEVSYVFILPLISILILYKNPKLIRVMMWLTMFVLITSNLYKGRVKGMMEFVSSIDCALQFAIVLCCYACTNMAIKHLVASDGALTGSIRSNLHRVVQTVEQVKGASTDYPDIRGFMRLYQTRNGVLISTDIKGLPYYPDSCKHRIYGYHIHDGNKCEGDMQDPFSHAMSHYNPNNCIHPFHAGATSRNSHPSCGELLRHRVLQELM